MRWPSRGRHHQANATKIIEDGRSRPQEKREIKRLIKKKAQGPVAAMTGLLRKRPSQKDGGRTETDAPPPDVEAPSGDKPTLDRSGSKLTPERRSTLENEEVQEEIRKEVRIAAGRLGRVFLYGTSMWIKDQHLDIFFRWVYVRRADTSPMNRGDAAAATWIFRGNKSRRRRGRDVDIRSRRPRVGSKPEKGRRDVQDPASCFRDVWFPGLESGVCEFAAFGASVILTAFGHGESAEYPDRAEISPAGLDFAMYVKRTTRAAKMSRNGARATEIWSSPSQVPGHVPQARRPLAGRRREGRRRRVCGSGGDVRLRQLVL